MLAAAGLRPGGLLYAHTPHTQLSKPGRGCGVAEAEAGAESDIAGAGSREGVDDTDLARAAHGSQKREILGEEANKPE